MIAKYFTARQLNDRDMLGVIAVEPVQIKFKRYKILSIDRYEKTDLKLPALLKELEMVKKMAGKFGVNETAILSRVKEIKRNINHEKKITLFSTGIDRDLEMCTGITYTSKVKIKVETGDGEVKCYLFRLRQDRIKLQGEDKEHIGRMIITKIEPVE